ncbi:hypothetical protein HKD37_20G055959 [Glycine soja]
MNTHPLDKYLWLSEAEPVSLRQVSLRQAKFFMMASGKRARAEDIPSSSNPPPPTTTMEPDGLQAQPIVPMPMVSMEQFLDKVAWPEAQLPLGRSPEVVPSSPIPTRTEPAPVESQPPVVDPPASPEVEILPPPPAPPAPPLILIPDDSDNEVAAPPDSPAYYLEDGSDFSD